MSKPKKRKIKKAFVVIPETSKNHFDNIFDMSQAKKALRLQLSLDEMLTALAKRDIVLVCEDVKAMYNQTHRIQKIYNYYIQYFDQQLTAMNIKNELFDADFLLYAIDKILLDHPKMKDLADPDLLCDQINEYYASCSYKDKPKRLIHFLKIINQYQHYHETKQLEEIMEDTLFNLPEWLCQCFLEDLKERYLTKEIIQSLAQELSFFLESYEIPSPYCQRLKRFEQQLNERKEFKQ